jgi:ribosomal protein S18 acetylase RimI-like enzyme
VSHGAGQAFRIRRAVPDDARALARLRYEFRAGLGSAPEPEDSFVKRCAAWMRGHLAVPGEWYCWIAHDSGAIAGTIWLQLIDKLPNPVAERERHAYITSLYVRPEHRCAGVGSALLDAALAECDARDVDAVLLWPTPRSRSLYRRHGFAPAADLLERRGSR